MLVANGAVIPLLNLVLRALPETSSVSTDAAETAAWALSLLTKSSPKAVRMQRANFCSFRLPVRKHFALSTSHAPAAAAKHRVHLHHG